MKKDNTYEQYIKDFRLNLLSCKLLGKGHNGSVYLLPDNKIIKVCIEEKSCHSEYYILNRVNGNKYFPRVYGMCGNYMIRDYVGGVTLKDYIKSRGMNKELVLNIADLLQEFKKLKFKKIDIRCRDIYVQEDMSLKVIDPKKCYSKYRDYPRHLVKGLRKLEVLDFFMSVLKEERRPLYRKWKSKIDRYVEEKDKEEED
jgi:RIO-like serine/threonine protein kinase